MALCCVAARLEPEPAPEPAPEPSADEPGSAERPEESEESEEAEEAEDFTLDERRVYVSTASRTSQAIGDTAVTTQVLGRERIEASGAENLAEMLEEQPGLQVQRGFAGAGGAGIQMQGLDPRYTLILVDGQRVTGRINGVIDLTRFQAEDIEQVEIVQGPSSSLYGSDAMGGVVNIITRKSKKLYESELHASYGSFNTADLSARTGLRRDRWGLTLTGGWHHTDGFTIPDPERPEADQSTTGNAQNSANVALAADYTPDVPVDLRVGTRVDFQHRDVRGVLFSAPRANYDRRNLTRIVNATVTPEIRWSAPARLRFIGRYAYFNDLLTSDQRGSDAMDSRERTIDQIAELTTQYDHTLAGPRTTHTITTGAQASFEQIEAARVTGDNRRRYRYALYVQDEWLIAQEPRVMLVPSARLDLDSQFGSVVTPKIAGRLDPLRWLTLRASYGLGFRAPDFKELYLQFANQSVGYVVIGNPELKPEYSRGFNGGAELRAREWGQLSVAYFHNQIDNLISTPTSLALFENGTTVFQYINISEAQTQGVETRAALRVLKHFALDGSYTFTDARDRTPDADGSLQERALPQRPRHQGAFRLSFHHEEWGTRAQLRGAVFGRQPFDTATLVEGDSDTVFLDPYLSLDVRVSQSFLKHFSVFVGADNLANAGDPDYLPIVPRSFYGGLTLRYWLDEPLGRPRRR